MSLPANPPHTKICIHNSNLYFNLYVSVNWFGWETCGSLETNPESRDVPLPNRLYQVLSTRFSGYYYHHHHHRYYYYDYYYKVAPSSMEWLSIFSLGTMSLGMLGMCCGVPPPLLRELPDVLPGLYIYIWSSTMTSGERPLPTSGGHGFGPHGSIGQHSCWPGLARPVISQEDEGRESPT